MSAQGTAQKNNVIREYKTRWEEIDFRAGETESGDIFFSCSVSDRAVECDLE